MNNLSLGDVQETALIPLSNRASEAMRKQPRVKDQKAVEIVKALNLDFKQYDKMMTHECVIARTIMFDETVRELIQRAPNSICINLGCGMDDRFSRVDNGQIQWFDVDLPDAIAARKKVYEEENRRTMVAGNVLETEWTEIIIAQTAGDVDSVIVVAEGLFMYFTKEENQKALQILADAFPSGTLVVEMMRPSAMDESKHETVKKTNAKFGWGTKSGAEFEELEPRMHLKSERSFSEQMKKSTWISRILGTLIQSFNNRIAVFEWRE